MLDTHSVEPRGKEEGGCACAWWRGGEGREGGGGRLVVEVEGVCLCSNVCVFKGVSLYSMVCVWLGRCVCLFRFKFACIVMMTV